MRAWRWRDIFVRLAIAWTFTFGCAPTTYWLELEYILTVSLNVPQDKLLHESITISGCTSLGYLDGLARVMGWGRPVVSGCFDFVWLRVDTAF